MSGVVVLGLSVCLAAGQGLSDSMLSGSAVATAREALQVGGAKGGAGAQQEETAARPMPAVSGAEAVYVVGGWVCRH